MIDVLDTIGSLPLLNISSTILAKVIEFCKFDTKTQRKSTKSDQSITIQDGINEWNAKFVKVHEKTLHILIMVSACGV